MKLSMQQAKLLSEVQFSVGVEIGELSMSAEELIDLLPGHVFEFAFDPLEPVVLSVGEEEVAKARFVTRDGSLALEIISVGMGRENEKNLSLPETQE